MKIKINMLKRSLDLKRIKIIRREEWARNLNSSFKIIILKTAVRINKFLAANKFLLYRTLFVYQIDWTV